MNNVLQVWTVVRFPRSHARQRRRRNDDPRRSDSNHVRGCSGWHPRDILAASLRSADSPNVLRLRTRNMVLPCLIHSLPSFSASRWAIYIRVAAKESEANDLITII